MRHLIPVMKNRYGGVVECSDNEIKAYNAAGELMMFASLDGNGSIVDHSAALGLAGSYSLEPIPKNTRLWEHQVIGGVLTLVKTKDHDERKAGLSEYLCEKGIVQSCAALEKKGYKFDASQRVEKKPLKAEAPAPIE